MHYASAVARRLPATFAALAAGRIHPVHLRIIADETSILSDADAAKADAILAEAAPGKTFGEVRAAAHKLILQLDPEAARKRKEAARGEARLRRFREASGNGGMVARELPSDEVLTPTAPPRRTVACPAGPRRPAPGPGLATRPPDQDDPGRPRPLRPCARRGRLPPQPQTPAPDPGPQRHLHRARLPSARGPLRPGPFRPVGPGRPHLRM